MEPNILVLMMEANHSEVIKHNLRLAGNNVSFIDNYMNPNDTIDVIARRLERDRFDIFFVDGMIAYNTK